MTDINITVTFKDQLIFPTAGSKIISCKFCTSHLYFFPSQGLMFELFQEKAIWITENAKNIYSFNFLWCLSRKTSSFCPRTSRNKDLWFVIWTMCRWLSLLGCSIFLEPTAAYNTFLLHFFLTQGSFCITLIFIQQFKTNRHLSHEVANTTRDLEAVWRYLDLARACKSSKNRPARICIQPQASRPSRHL